MSESLRRVRGFVVEEVIDGAHPKLETYPLLPGDIVVEGDPGVFMKECPGLAVGGFRLSVEQMSRLRPVLFERHGLDYRIVGAA